MEHHNRYRPYASDSTLGRCQCGQHSSEAEHQLALQVTESAIEQNSHDFVEAALMKAIFPKEVTRRQFLKTVGAGTALAAISSILPIQSLQAMALEKRPLEKKTLDVGFIPITCATPLIMAHPMGLYKEQGLNVQLQKVAGWALVRDRMLNNELDASHFLAPMPIFISMGIGSSAQPMRVASVQNTNGQSITLALKHKNNRDPKNWKGFRFAIPYEQSMHNFLLRYYLAEHGLNPDRDIQIRVTPPAEMIANLRAGNIDGFLGPDPFNQRAVYEEVGFIHILSKDIWDGHPCCAFGTSQAFIQQNPNTFAALYRTILKSANLANQPENLMNISKVISKPNYLNQPEIVVRQTLTGRFADGLGNVIYQPNRAGFDPMPWDSMAIWILTQMKRWGYLKANVNYQDIAKQIFLMTDAEKQMKELGVFHPNEYQKRKKIIVMGKVFDPTQPDAYINSFKIKRTS
ncbi:MAG: nitrate ABC transporter substrate-binding protein [Pseudomonadales bacterium RIFCSPHIGHO2_12_FULL_40_16]|jgi:nitrate/nitrite transport system substrate-binding protein|uniref:Nitrate ABC transporter substrate-binding protein n=2 Tax=Acinetobacter TaxID=469 RepID=N9DJ14_9GAMM|nr:MULTISPECIES: ABC transporter substrate-binding protein [Acinetobacter]OHC21583.1 MAG: nitrate ABC transporter substrate-binding protein [Pseudomonadales bacterium RIFCSPHIGHO2_12_FULL_40_16]ENU87770.1 hypothetical protein F972_02943 [Acinetobacter sp. CIP 102529]ENV80795.1 hypothetical protein F942_00479 [Acinetobacter ursingii ANC 3649]MCU4394539.1 ABC transporter substrate-binding protein [Acinetobacter parvus]QQT59206.1 ABC transporter substrate-binding protein [Acinetobacter johnsonii]